MKAKTAYVCSECGAVALQWFGSCPSCGAAGTLSEAASQPRGARSTAKAIPLEDAPRGYAEFDSGAATKFVLNPHGYVSV